MQITIDTRQPLKVTLSSYNTIRAIMSRLEMGTPDGVNPITVLYNDKDLTTLMFTGLKVTAPDHEGKVKLYGFIPGPNDTRECVEISIQLGKARPRPAWLEPCSDTSIEHVLEEHESSLHS